MNRDSRRISQIEIHLLAEGRGDAFFERRLRFSRLRDLITRKIDVSSGRWLRPTPAPCIPTTAWLTMVDQTSAVAVGDGLPQPPPPLGVALHVATTST